MPIEPRSARPRRVVIVAPFFPPSALPPAHRARMFVRRLPEYGWEPIVVTVAPEYREERQEPVLLRTVPDDVPVETVRAVPARLSRRLGIGDVALRALPFVTARVARVARRSGASAICLLVPPWYLLLAATPLRRLTGRPVVVDYIDPWRLAPVPGLKARLARWVAEHLEGWCLRGVDGVFSVSPRINAELAERFPFVAGRPQAAEPYGLEPDDFETLVEAAAAPAPDARVRITYIGSISHAMQPVFAALLDAIAALRDARPEVAGRLRLELFGTTYGAGALARAQLDEAVRARGLEAWVTEHPERIPYAEALARMSSADANLIVGDMTSYYAASKLMPMLRARRPVVALLEERSEPARVLRHLGAPGLVEYSAETPERAPARVVPALCAMLERAARGELPPVHADFDADDLLRSRTASAMTGALAGVLDAVAGHTMETRA